MGKAIDNLCWATMLFVALFFTLDFLEAFYKVHQPLSGASDFAVKVAVVLLVAFFVELFAMIRFLFLAWKCYVEDK